jgi:transcriptional regulator with XRE-family HTH domain
MPTNINAKIRSLHPDQRKKVEERARQLVSEEMTLRELRRARKLTQIQLAKTLNVSQDSVSRMENRSNLMLATLRKTIEAMGGSLSLVVQFPDQDPVMLSGLTADDTEE